MKLEPPEHAHILAATFQSRGIVIPHWAIILAFPVLLASMGIVATSFAGEAAAKLDRENAQVVMPRIKRLEEEERNLTLQVQRNADAVTRIEKAIEDTTTNVGYNQRLLIKIAIEQGIALPPHPGE